MCGIAGMLGHVPLAEAQDAVDRMISSLRHRGPDGSGRTWVTLPGTAGHVVLGHARLSILDLTQSAAQPMHEPETGSWLVYNGEIYNFRELRRELTSGGCTFRSRGDTEVLLRLLVKWGEDGLSRLRGMYSFAFWDGPRQRLLLARDPLGIKPLLFTHTPDGVVFASELRALVASGIVPLTLNRLAVNSCLTYGMTVEPTTIASEVAALPPGHFVTVDPLGEVSPPHRFWSLDHLLAQPAGHQMSNGRVGRTAVRAELARAVASHLVSDVPVGVLLSGGVDSSLVATLASRADGQELHFLTVGYAEREFSEAEHARKVAARLGHNHTVIHLSVDDLLGMLPRAIEAMDQPTVDGLNTYAISRAAADLGIKVLLSGLGGDEIFGGYTTFWKVPWLARHSAWLSRVAKVYPTPFGGSSVQWHKIAQSRNVCGLAGAYLVQRSIRWRGAAACLADDAVPPDDAAVPPETWDAMATDAALDDMYHVARLEMLFYLRNQLLRDADIFSSANSVELRVPFLDLGLIQKAWRISASDHISFWGGGKKVLKSILAELHPGFEVGRFKMGFVFPWTRWLRGPLFETVADTFNTSRLFEGLGLDQRDGQRLLGSFMKGDPLVSWMQVWSLFVLLRWHEQFRLAT